MSPRQPLPIRHCPLCRIAMQARRSSSAPAVDVFECLSCHTVIRESKSDSQPSTPPSISNARDET